MWSKTVTFWIIVAVGIAFCAFAIWGIIACIETIIKEGALL
ncbi:hypothetical protein [Mycoplasmoides pneumoniae]|nr:hypothetical protein [Mycoplasmoides pneumoniae]